MDTRSIVRTIQRVLSRREVFTIDLSKEDPAIQRMWIIRTQLHLLHKGKKGGLYYFS